MEWTRVDTPRLKNLQCSQFEGEDQPCYWLWFGWRSFGRLVQSFHAWSRKASHRTNSGKCGFVKCVVLNSKLTMHFSFKHFVLRRSIAFWFLSENLKRNAWCEHLRESNLNTWVCHCPIGTQVVQGEGRTWQGWEERFEFNHLCPFSIINCFISLYKFQSPVNHVVHMDLGSDGLSGSHHQDSSASQLGKVRVP